LWPLGCVVASLLAMTIPFYVSNSTNGAISGASAGGIA
jgi:hypothetical protein